MTGSDASLLFRSAIATSVSNLDSFRRDRPNLDTRKEGWTEHWGGKDTSSSSVSADDEADTCGWRARPEDWDAEDVVTQRWVLPRSSNLYIILHSSSPARPQSLHTSPPLSFESPCIRQYQGIGHAFPIDTIDLVSAPSSVARAAGPSYCQDPSHCNKLALQFIGGRWEAAMPQGCRFLDNDKRR